MGRKTKDFIFNGNAEALFNEVHSFLLSEGYKYIDFKGEAVFKKGSGLMTGPSFLKITFSNGFVRLEGWMKYAILPGVYVGEIDLESFVGSAVKGPLKKRFATIEATVYHYGGMSAGQPAYYQQPVAPAPQFQQPVTPVQQTGEGFCEKCGEPYLPDAAFCMKCGNKK